VNPTRRSAVSQPILPPLRCQLRVGDKFPACISHHNTGQQISNDRRESQQLRDDAEIPRREAAAIVVMSGRSCIRIGSCGVRYVVNRLSHMVDKKIKNRRRVSRETPPDRRKTISTVREVLKKNLPKVTSNR